MPDRPGPFSTVARIVLAALLWLGAVGSSWPQGAGSPPAFPPARLAPDESAPPQGGGAKEPDAAENPGLFHEMGKVLEKSLSVLPSLKSPGETLDDLNTRAKDAARGAGESLSHLAKPSSVAAGRVICPRSANGAADCKSAADKLCQAKGSRQGKSLTTDSVEVCSPKVLIPGRTRKADDCRTDNYVTRALCE
jgi:hypothetical protein